MGNMDVWYAHVDVEEFAELAARQATAKQVKRFEKNVAKALNSIARVVMPEGGHPVTQVSQVCLTLPDTEVTAYWIIGFRG